MPWSLHIYRLLLFFFFFFFNDTATTEIYTLSLHDALPISARIALIMISPFLPFATADVSPASWQRSVSVRRGDVCRSEEHTSELQSRSDLVCRLLLEKKKQTKIASC